MIRLSTLWLKALLHVVVTAELQPRAARAGPRLSEGCPGLFRYRKASTMPRSIGGKVAAVVDHQFPAMYSAMTGRASQPWRMLSATPYPVSFVSEVRQARLRSHDPAQQVCRDVDHGDPPSAFPQRPRHRHVAARAGQPPVDHASRRLAARRAHGERVNLAATGRASAS
jgi:hypothetical protein